MRVIDGAEVWRLHAEMGFPLDLSVPMLWDEGEVPSWDRLLTAAAKDGANLPRLVERLKMAVRDCATASDAKYVARGLDLLLGRMKGET